MLGQIFDPGGWMFKKEFTEPYSAPYENHIAHKAPPQRFQIFLFFVKTTQNSTGGTGTHSAGKLTKTEVDGKEDS